MPDVLISHESLERIEKELPEILAHDPTMNRLEIAIKLGFRSRQTLHRAGKANPKIEEMLDVYDKEREPNLNDLIRKTWEKRLVNGTAQPSEYLFYMMNKYPAEFQDRRALFNNTNLVNVKVGDAQEKYIQSLPEKDLNDFINGIAERRKVQLPQS
jgi:hypothetical protein